MKNPKRILICRPDRIGDVILATPLIREIRLTFPNIFLAALVSPYTKDLLINNPHIDDIIIDDSTDRTNKYFWSQVKLINKYKFDTALMLLPTERLAWMLFFARISYSIGVGTKLYQILTFTRSVNRNKYIPLRHEADYCMDLGRKVGVKSKSLKTEIFLHEEERTNFYERIIQPIKSKLKNSKVFLCIHPGNNHSAPNWTPNRYADLILSLLKDDRFIIILTGIEKEKTYFSDQELYSSANLINLMGRLSLRDLCNLISYMNIVISSSTGPMHIAAALKISTISLFCPLTACSPALWGPIGNKSSVILPSDNYCSNYCKNDPHTCSLNEGIAVETVLNEINNLLDLMKKESYFDTKMNK